VGTHLEVDISFCNTQLVQVAVVNDILVPYVAVQID
jgi:hypothetical protein